MASKFWGRGTDSEEESEDEVSSEEEETSSEDESSSDESGSESGSDSESESSDESEDGKKRGASRFLMGSSESESEDERRVVRSAKDKATEDLLAVCNEIRNKMHINDWAAIQTLWDKLTKQLDKVQKVSGALGTPRPYVKILVELEDFLNKTLADKPKLSPTNQRALTRMKQTLRKTVPGYAEQMAAFRANPESPEPSEGPSSASSEASDSETEEELDSEAEAERQFRMVRTGVVARPKDRILSMDPKEISYEMVQKKLQEVAAARGRATSLDRQDQVEMLTYLAGVSRGPAQRVEVLVHLITVVYDMNQPTVSPMTTPNWQRCAATLMEIMALLEAHPNISMVDQPPEEEPRTEEPPEDEPVKVWGNPAAFLERLDEEWTGSLKALDPHAHAYMDRLKDELPLLALAAEVATYLRRLGKEGVDKLAGVALRRIDHLYYKTGPVYDAMRKMAELLREEQAAAAGEAGDGVVAAAQGAVQADGSATADDGEGGVAVGNDSQTVPVVRLPAEFQLPEQAGPFLDALAKEVYTYGTDNQKGQAMLAVVYWKSIHDDFYGARDMLLMSRISEQTAQLETRMQVLFNRTTAQLGLCAFRAGLISEAHACLTELYGSGRVKELLAQGVAQHHRWDRTPEQEAAERRRQVPFHLHINLELLEASFLTCATLLEIPHAAAVGPVEARKRVQSKPLRRLMDLYDRNTFIGPPENVRDHIMAACRALTSGDWRRSYGYVTALQCWGLLGGAKDGVLAILRKRFQEEGLRTYLLAHSQFYSSLSLEQLAATFELPRARVHAIISKMIADDALPGSHDQPTGTVVMRHEDATRLQGTVAQLADKASVLVELNERALAMRTGVLHAEDDEEGGRRGPSDGAPGAGGRRTRMGGGRGPLGGHGGGGGRGRGRGGGRGGRFGGGGGGSSGFMAEAGFSGGVYGRGRSRPSTRDESNYMVFHRGMGGGGGGGGGYNRGS